MTTSPSAPPAAGDPATLGFASALGAFLIWGLAAPVYFKQLTGVATVEIVAHRVLWTVLLVGALVLATTGTAGIRRVLDCRRRLGALLLTTLLISLNWSLFTWAMTHDRLIESSLGYYINPIVNVVLGVVFLHERLSRRQLGAVLLAGAGVGSLVLSYGAVPWLALALALSFGFYALVRKKAAIDPVVGLLVETALMMPAALLYLLWLVHSGAGAFGAQGPGTDLLLVMAGPVTAVPLLLFTVAASRLKLSTLGLMQYIGPTGQLLLGVLVYGEAFTAGHALAFGCIWLALALYSADAVSAHRAARAAGGPAQRDGAPDAVRKMEA